MSNTKNALVLLVAAIALLIASCQAPTPPDVLANALQRLSEKERLFAMVALSHFDLRKPGEIIVGIEGQPVSSPLLHYLNAASPKLRFANPKNGVVLAWIFNLSQLDYFHPDYVYLHIEYRSSFNGRGDSFGHVLRRNRTEWHLIDTFQMGEYETLDRTAYIRGKIEAKK